VLRSLGPGSCRSPLPLTPASGPRAPLAPLTPLLSPFPACSNADLTKVIAKFPRILEYKSERTIRPRLDFLRRCGVVHEDLAKVGGVGCLCLCCMYAYAAEVCACTWCTKTRQGWADGLLFNFSRR
jgi:hypothetical protein